MGMSKGRLEAFSDGVFAIIITIMVLDLKAPHRPDLDSLRPLIPIFLSYVLSFIYVGIYWNNHHHLFQVVRHIKGGVLWANLHLLFWLSLVPVITNWVGDTNFADWPVAIYGVVLFLAGFAYWILVQVLLRHEGPGSPLALAVGADFKGKLSLAIYLLAVLLAFVHPLIACFLYSVVAAIWLVPDRRIERTLKHHAHELHDTH
ncbi:MAG TPA: TMEM175 family protein [Gemmatales bacterium]|nr:TMEM175 family protein [Gemmatales bacterium]